MALLFASFPHSHSISFFPNALRPPKQRRRLSLLSVGAQTDDRSSALVWFKHDLRADDHTGLAAAASKHGSLVPLYVFDRRILRRFSDEMLEMVILALEDLRTCLRSRGSNLMVRFGRVENVIPKLAIEVNSTHVYAEEEVEHDLCELMDLVDDSLNTLQFSSGKPELVLWRNPFYSVEKLMDIPDSYDVFDKLKVGVSSPLPTSELPLPGVNMEIDWGSIPSLSVLMDFMEENSPKPLKSWNSIKAKSAEAVLVELLKPGQSSRNISSFDSDQNIQRKRVPNSAFATRKGSAVGGGTCIVSNALAAYLRYLEGTARDDWQELHENVRRTESREGASFTKLFGPALALGIISRRRVHYEAIKYERERNGGFLSPFGYSTVSIAAAIDAICSMEWYWLMSRKSQTSGATSCGVRIWRWNNHLIQYTVSGHKGPAVLLVHGFGAFLEHYRDNTNDLAEAGNRVWAITMLGFGRSEKPNIVYTELMWTELLRDFIIEVVGEPANLVGNSIGGYFIAILARLWPTLAESVVLINSAGNVVPGYSFVPLTKERQTSGATWLGARFISFYLKSSLKNLLKNCYPTRKERVDDQLIDEMLRASNDPGVLVVLESIFSFNLSLPLNFLLKDLSDKVLVIQGMKDPISDSKSKLDMIKEHCEGVAIKELDAGETAFVFAEYLFDVKYKPFEIVGHCPHDEVPELVNSILCEWVKKAQQSKNRVGTIA